jgi:hypothetical protein
MDVDLDSGNVYEFDVIISTMQAIDSVPESVDEPDPRHVSLGHDVLWDQQS